MCPSLSPRQLQSLKMELEERLEALQFELRRMQSAVSQPEAVATSSRKLGLLQAELKACEEALERIARNRFGICESCGEFIELNRLLAAPTLNRCLSCRPRPSRPGGA